MVPGRHPLLHGAQLLALGLEMVIDPQHFLVDSGVLPAAKGQHRLLPQVADAGVAGQVNRPSGRPHLADQDLEQGGFTDPVGADQADPAVVGDAGGDIFEQVNRPKRMGQLMKG